MGRARLLSYNLMLKSFQQFNLKSALNNSMVVILM